MAGALGTADTKTYVKFLLVTDYTDTEKVYVIVRKTGLYLNEHRSEKTLIMDVKQYDQKLCEEKWTLYEKDVFMSDASKDSREYYLKICRKDGSEHKTKTISLKEKPNETWFVRVDREDNNDKNAMMQSRLIVLDYVMIENADPKSTGCERKLEYIKEKIPLNIRLIHLAKWVNWRIQEVDTSQQRIILDNINKMIEPQDPKQQQLTHNQVPPDPVERDERSQILKAIADLFSIPEIAASSATMANVAHDIIFSNGEWNEQDTDAIHRLIVFPSVCRSKEYVQKCISNLKKQIESQKITCTVFRDILLSEPFRQRIDDTQNALMDIIRFLENKRQTTSFNYFYRFAILHLALGNSFPKVVDECNRLLFSIEVKVENLVNLFDRGKSMFSEDELNLATHHIIHIVNDQLEDQVEDQIGELMDSFEKIERQGATDLQKYLLGQEALSYVHKLEPDDFKHLSNNPANNTIRYFEVICRTKAAWDVVFKDLKKKDFSTHTHEYYEKLVRSVKETMSSLKLGRFAFEFADFLKAKEETLSTLIELIRKLEEKRAISSFWEDAKTKAFEMVDICRKRSDVLAQFVTFSELVNKGGRNVADINAARTQLTEIERIVKSGSDIQVIKAESEDFWGILYPVLGVAMEVEGYFTSRIFLNVCRMKYEGFQTSLSIADLALDLRDNCVPIYIDHCEKLFGSASGLDTAYVYRLLLGVERDELLTNELGIAKAKIKKITYGIQNTDVDGSMDMLKKFIRYRRDKSKYVTLKAFFNLLDASKPVYDVQMAIWLLAELQEKSDTHTQLSLSKLNNAIARVDELDLNNEDWLLLDGLGKSEELVPFMRQIIKSGEDLRNLADAVEEHEEQSLQAAIVTDLIDVKRFIEAIINVKDPSKIYGVIVEIKRKREEADELSKKIQACVGNIFAVKHLHRRMSNRDEVIKDTIKDTTSIGYFKLTLGKDETTYTAKLYFKGHEERTFSLEKLQDLKSRALFALNSKGAFQADDSLSHHKEFIQIVSTATEVIKVLNRLKEAGHFHFVQEKTIDTSKHSRTLAVTLDMLLQELENEHQVWESNLETSRSKYYYLNFFSSKQLLLLEEQLSLVDRSRSCENDEYKQLTIEELFTRVNIRSSRKSASSNETHFSTETYSWETKDKSKYHNRLKKRISDIGEKLTKYTSPLGLATQENVNRTTGVFAGSVYVVDRDEDSRPVPVLLEVYKSTYGFIPDLAYWQVLFCHQNTTLEDVKLVLARCKEIAEEDRPGPLFSLVNVELLSRDAQIYIVEKVRSLIVSKVRFMLAIVSTGGSSNHILSHLPPEHIHRLNGLDDDELTEWLRERWAEFEIVTSDDTGQGKTEYVMTKAMENDMDVVKVSISGPVTRKHLVQQFCKKSLRENTLLHIDAGMMSDPYIFDTFLLELTVIGTVYSGVNVFCLNTFSESPAFVCLEIANTFGDKLLNAVSASRFFRRVHISWRNFDKYNVSTESQSSVKVVCRYLDALTTINHGQTGLDQSDIILTENGDLSEERCKILLQKQFENIQELSFTKVEMYLNVFAEELRRMSASTFFKVSELSKMSGERSKTVRSQIVCEINKASKTFGSHASKDVNSEVSTGSSMIERVQTIIKWEGSNHVLLVFNSQDTRTVSLLYREKEKVPGNILELLETQLDRTKELPDYNTMKEHELQNVLIRVCCSHPPSRDLLAEINYVITPDNLLKMILIYKRLKARIPVIIMGHTGCGKTLLITYLAKICDVDIRIFNIHAGTQIDHIHTFMETVKREAKEKTLWVFFDEINTSQHLGILGDIVVNHSFHGQRLPTNLVFMAACNPYITRKKSTKTAGGLDGKCHFDGKSKFVYRVEPLPENVLQYVWDFGTLQPNDEEKYIKRMIQDLNATSELKDIFASLVKVSQEFIREIEGNKYCVSLRDVSRCKVLASFFITEWFVKKNLATSPRLRDVENTKHERIWKRDELVLRGIILALAHCYHSRLIETTDRGRYLALIADGFVQKYPFIKSDFVEAVIEAEQLHLLEHMELPPGTALNSALKENVFIILVSILARIPIFVVGNPGCSKSLSLQLINNSLRGKDSKSEFFQLLPTIFMFRYQGSESSTSDGITKVFDRARQCMVHSPNVLPVVLLDEVGLAELSPANPLKILHSLLEPGKGVDKIPVVGLSNWALDAAKMNRAVYLTRPKPTKEDLVETAKAILGVTDKPRSGQKSISDSRLGPIKQLASAYSKHIETVAIKNFHGLRDFYALVKYIADKPARNTTGTSIATDSRNHMSRVIEDGLLRNFGGLQTSETEKMLDLFLEEMNTVKQSDEASVLERIKSNVRDKTSRHLMLIMEDESMVSQVEDVLRDMEREYFLIIGSQMDHDTSEEYFYKVLSDIILYMEKGVTVVLKDLESIYGSLYDMLNQNYTMAGSKRCCRIALGPYKSPLCEVHDNFQCIVLIDKQDVNEVDPPFLNRFEKQMLTFSDMLSDAENDAVSQLKKWVSDLKPQNVQSINSSARGSHVQLGSVSKSLTNSTHSKQLTDTGHVHVSTVCGDNDDTAEPQEVFYGFNKDNLASVIYNLRGVESESNVSSEKMFSQCKGLLMKTACPSAMLRSYRSKFAQDKPNDHQELVENYFASEHHYGHDGFAKFVKTKFSGKNLTQSMTLIYTLSGIHNNLQLLLKDEVQMLPTEVERLWTFKSEQQLRTRLRRFWFKSKASLFILQCLPEIDGPSMQLARYLLDKYQNEYVKRENEKKKKGEKVEEVTPKHVCVIVHINRPNRTDEKQPWQYGFLRGWCQLTIDCLDPSKPNVKDILKKKTALSQVITDFGCAKFQMMVRKELKWCVACLKYPTEERASSSELENKVLPVLQDENLIHPLVIVAEKHREANVEKQREDADRGNWLVGVACNESLLHTHGTLDAAVTEKIRLCIRSNLGKMMYLIENNSLSNGFEKKDADRVSFWKNCFQSTKMFNISSPAIPEPQGPGSCVLLKKHDFRFPFFNVCHKKIQHFKGKWREETRQMARENSDTKSDKRAEILVGKIQEDVPESMFKEYLKNNIDVYIKDVFRAFTADHFIDINTNAEFDVVKWYFTHKTRSLLEEDVLTRIALLYVDMGTHQDQIVTELQLLLMYQRFNKQTHMLSTLEDIIQKRTPSDGQATMQNVMRNVLDAVCKLSLPTRNVLTAIGGVAAWQRSVSLVIHYAERVEFPNSTKPIVFHFLRLCRDFVNILSSQFTIDENDVVELADLGTQLKVNLFEGVFEFIQKQVNKYMSSNINDRAFLVLDEFQCVYFARAFEANPDDCGIEEMLTYLSNEDKNPKAGAGPLLYRIVKTDVDEFQDPKVRKSFAKYSSVEDLIIRTDTIPDEFPNLQLLDDYLRDIPHNHHMAVLCCDVIERIRSKDMTRGITVPEKITSDDPIFVTAAIASEIIHKTTECSLQLLFAIAFISAIFKSLLRLDHEVMVDLCERNPELAETLNKILCKQQKEEDELQTKRVSSLRLHLIKTIRRQLPVRRLRHRCMHLTSTIPSLKDLSWQLEASKLCLDYSPMSYVPSYDNVQHAITDELTQRLLVSGKPSKLTDVMSRVTYQKKQSMAFVAVLIDKFFLVRATRPLNDVEKEFAKWVLQAVNRRDKLQTEYKALIKFLVDSDSPCVLPNGDKLKRFIQLSVFVHLATPSLSIIKNSPDHSPDHRSYARCVILNTDLNQIFLPGSGLSRHSLTMLTEESIIGTPDLGIIYCQCCGHRGTSMFPSHAHQSLKYSRCPVCSSRVKRVALRYETKHAPNEQQRGYHGRDIRNAKAVDLTTRKMSPIAYRTMNVLLHGSFLIGLLVSNDSVWYQKLELLLDFHDDKDSGDTKTLLQQYLWKRIDEDWNVLQNLLGLGIEDTSLFLHCLIKEGWEDGRRQGKLLGMDFNSQFETKFSIMINEQFKKEAEVRKSFKEESQKGVGLKATEFERRLQESDSCTEDDQKKELQSLLRNKCSITFKSLKVSVVNNLENVAADHPFLSMFICMKERLECVGHIKPLLSWYHGVKDALNHQIERHEAGNTIKYFLEKSALGSTPERQILTRELFQEFQNSWNIVRNHWRILTGKEPCFKEMTDERKLSVCLPTAATKQTELQEIIEVLLNVQNQFLEKTLHIAASGKCSSLAFLVNMMSDEHFAVLPTVPLIEAGSLIIQFRWDDKFLIHSYNSTEYGSGRTIKHNYPALERQLCGALVTNKTFISSEHTFGKFTFKNELFNIFGSIQDLSSSIVQTLLPAHIANAVTNIKPEVCKDIMENIESCLQHGFKGVSEDISVVQYIAQKTHVSEKWFAEVCPSLIEVKLCHIQNLYEKLEEVRAEVVISTLPEELKETLPNTKTWEGDVTLASKVVSKARTEKIDQLKQLLSLVKLFVYRYLRQSIDAIDEAPSYPLAELVKQRGDEIFLKRDKVQMLVEFLHIEVKLCHVKAVVDVLKTNITTKQKTGHAKTGQQTKRNRRVVRVQQFD